jgi:branched-chain amino acid transport system ATP-binding protein
MEVLRLDRLSKSFGAIQVADGVSLSVAEGDALGIIGPNGAGKTSLFNLISGALRPDSGRVCFLGRDITGLSMEQRCRAGIGRTYQIPRPFTRMTVMENCLVAAVAGGRKRESQTYDHCAGILRQMRLLRKANQMAGSLTLLERKALELARALSSSPRLLLLDEIAGGLTERESEELVQLIRRIHTEGATILWIEHIVNALMAVANRLTVINFGTKILDGPPAEVMESAEVKRIYLGMEAA